MAYEHNDPAALEAAINENAGTYRRALLVTDGVFSMDGDIAPLPALYEVAQKHDLMFMVDDAHGEGVLGKGGRGIVDHFGLHGKVDIEVGTLSKAFGVVGGLVAGNKIIIEWLRQRGRPFLFSSAMTAPDAAACIAAIDLLESSTELVDKLWDNASFFKAEMKKLGFDTGVSETPITPVMLGEAPLAQQFSRELFENGVFAMAHRLPDRGQGQGAHPRDDLCGARPRRPGTGAGGLREGGQEAGSDPVGRQRPSQRQIRWSLASPRRQRGLDRFFPVHRAGNVGIIRPSAPESQSRSRDLSPLRFNTTLRQAASIQG